MALWPSWVTWGLTLFRNPRERPRTHSTGLANEPARTLPASRPWCRWPAFASGVLPGLVLVPIDAGGTPLRSPAKTSSFLSPNIPIGHVWRPDLTQMCRWTQTQAPSAPRAAIRCFFSSSRQVLSGDAALNEGDGLVAEIATSLPIAQSKRIE